MKTMFGGAVLMLVMSASCFSGAEVGSIKWQRPLPEYSAAAPKRFADISEISIKETDKKIGPLRVMISVVNKNTDPLEAVILRCAFSMRIIKTDGSQQEGIWTVPFWVEERRVANVKPLESKEIPIPHIDLQTYIARLRGTGFWVDAVKIQVMAEPRRGDDLTRNMAEAVLPVLYK